MDAALAAKEAANLYLELGDSQFAKSMNTAGDFFFFDRKWEFAYDCYQAVILNPLPETEDFDVAVAFSNSGLALSKMRKYEEAITAFTEARKQYKALRDVENVGFCDSEISRSYSQLGDGVTAEAFASASLDVAVTINKSRRVIWALYRLGRAQQVQNRHEEAIETFTDVLQKMKCSPAHWDESAIFVEAFKARSIRALGDEGSAREIERRLRNVAEIAFEPAELNEWLELLPG